ncbi:MAG: hypothetical protein WBL61_09300, partial [Bryobacteraceae bacterium]
MLLITSDVSFLDAALGTWEIVEYIAEGLVLAGCVGEYFSEFTEIRTEEWRGGLGKLSLLILIAGLTVELGALIRTNSLAGQEIALLNGVAADARVRAASAEVTAKGFDLEIAGARKDAEVAKEGAAKANERASINEKEAERFKYENLKLEAEIQPRALTLEQQRDMGHALLPLAGQKATIISLATDPEGYQLGEQIRAAFELAHRDVRDMNGKGIGGPSGLVGISVNYWLTENAANAVKKALVSLGHLDSVRQCQEFCVNGFRLV